MNFKLLGVNKFLEKYIQGKKSNASWSPRAFKMTSDSEPQDLLIETGAILQIKKS